MASKPSLFAVKRTTSIFCANYLKSGTVLLYRPQYSFHRNHQTLASYHILPVFITSRDLSQYVKSNHHLSHASLLKPTYNNFQWSYGLRKCSTVYQGFKDYESERRNFKIDVPEHYNFSRDVIDKWAEAEKSGERKFDLPAFWYVDKDGSEIKWSYQDVATKSNRVANILTEQCGLTAGDKAIVILPKIPAWWLFNIATIRAGIVMSPGTTLLRKKDIAHRLKSSEAKCIVADPNTADMVDQVSGDCPLLKCKLLVNSDSPREGWLNYEEHFEKASEEFECVNTKADDPMSIFFTSGTTGAPKMSEHTHVSYPLGHIQTARYFLLLTPTSVMWNMSDTGWAKAAYSNLFAPWISGSCVFIYNYSAFDPQEILQVLSKYPVTHFCCPPTAFRNFVKLDLSQFKFPHLRHCLCAGEPVNPEVIDSWKAATGLHMSEGYGQSETTLLCATYTCLDYKEGSMGKASPGVDLQIVDGEGNILPRGQEGEIGVRVKPVRPVGLFSRYVDNPDKTAQCFKGDFYLTGDRAYMDEDDYIFFVGRADDVIISAGYRIGPFEVESALLEHPAVLESAVVSSPDEERGEIVKAFVILTAAYADKNDTQLVKELQDHVKQTTAPYKYPRKIEFVKELPKTVSGKIRRIELRGRECQK